MKMPPTSLTTRLIFLLSLLILTICLCGSDGARERGRNDSRPKNKPRMSLPTIPTMTRLSNDSVMVRWEVVPEPGSLLIKFFRIQYREAGPDKMWETMDVDIAPHLTSQPVPGLTAGRKYKFRVAAVYTNDDNRTGKASPLFLLEKNPKQKKPLTIPAIVSTLPVSPSAIEIQWTLSSVDQVPLDGYYIHFRPSSSVQPYFSETIHGANTNSHIISHLLPDTEYDVKMQVWNLAGPSNFSNIVSNKTLPAPVASTTTSTEKIPVVLTTKPPSSSDKLPLMYVIVAGLTVAVFVIIVVVGIALCYIKYNERKQTVVAKKKPPKKLPKEKHPRAGSLHNNFNNHSAHHTHFPRTDYGNPFGGYITPRASALNAHLAKSVNGLAVNAPTYNGFVFRDAVGGDRKDITITTNPMRDNLRIDFEARSRITTSTTFGVERRSHSTRDLLRRSNHSLHQTQFNERSVDADDDVREDTIMVNNNVMHDMDGQSMRASMRRKFAHESHPNAFAGVKPGHRSTSFGRLNSTLERKKQIPIQPPEVALSSAAASSPSSSSNSSESNTENSSISNSHHQEQYQPTHRLHNQITNSDSRHKYYYHDKLTNNSNSCSNNNHNDEGLLTQVRNCSRENNVAANGRLVIMQSSC